MNSKSSFVFAGKDKLKSIVALFWWLASAILSQFFFKIKINAAM